MKNITSPQSTAIEVAYFNLLTHITTLIPGEYFSIRDNFIMTNSKDYSFYCYFSNFFDESNISLDFKLTEDDKKILDGFKSDDDIFIKKNNYHVHFESDHPELAVDKLSSTIKCTLPRLEECDLLTNSDVIIPNYSQARKLFNKSDFVDIYIYNNQIGVIQKDECHRHKLLCSVNGNKPDTILRSFNLHRVNCDNAKIEIYKKKKSYYLQAKYKIAYGYHIILNERLFKSRHKECKN